MLKIALKLSLDVVWLMMLIFYYSKTQLGVRAMSVIIIACACILLCKGCIQDEQHTYT